MSYKFMERCHKFKIPLVLFYVRLLVLLNVLQRVGVNSVLLKDNSVLPQMFWRKSVSHF